MLKTIAILFLLFIYAAPLKFILTVHRAQGAKCFYQHLTVHEKYFFQVVSRSHQNYRMDVMRGEGNTWQEVITKTADGVVQDVSKLAAQAGTYMFCLSNNDQNNVLRASFELMTGLEMVNLQHLPDNNDQQNLHREIDWLERQKAKILEVISRQENSGTTAADLSSSMNVKYVVLAVVGLASVVAVNAVFFFQTKKTLKDRKLI